MAPNQRLTLALVFTGTLLLALFAFIQTPEFTLNFRPLAETNLIQTLAPRTENLLRFMAFKDEMKRYRGAADSNRQACLSLNKYTNLSPDFKVNNQTLNTAYKGILIGCLMEGTVVPKNPELALQIAKSIKDIPPALSTPVGVLFMENGQSEEGSRLLERSLHQGNAQAGTALGSYYMNGSHGTPLDWQRAYRTFLQAADAGEPFAALNVAFISLQGRVQGPTEETFRTYLEKSLALRPEKATALLQAWGYKYGFGYPQDAAKAAELEATAKTYPSRMSFYVTDFFNLEGWGEHADTTQTLLLDYADHDLIDMRGQREKFFTKDGPTALYVKMQSDLLNSRQDKTRVKKFLANFSQTPAAK